MNKDKFAEGVGDKFYLRRKEVMEEPFDQIVLAIQRLNVSPKRVLEIGCSNGWRLHMIAALFDSDCYGIDPSSLAVANGNTMTGHDILPITLIQGTADDLPYGDDFFDCVIFGSCLYACDRKDLFKIAYQADRVLKENGLMIIRDFYPPFPQHNVIPDDVTIFSYKMDYSSMFSWSPCYQQVYRNIFVEQNSVAQDRQFVIVFEKTHVR